MEYKFIKYCDLNRWSSYWYQIKEILDSKPNSVLEFGCGDGVVGDYIRKNSQIQYASADNDEKLKPDHILNISDFDLSGKKFDTVCAFEVLEHLPFEQFKKCLGNLKNISNKYVLISLPHWGRHFSFAFQIPCFGKKKFQFKLSTGKEHKYNGEHYWEIGKKGYTLKKVISEISETGLQVAKHYICHESPYHHFFILKANDKKN